MEFNQREIVDATERAWSHLEWMCREVPERVSGLPAARRQADYLSDALTRAGYTTHQDVFPGLVSYPRPGALVILGDRAQRLEAYTFAHSTSTPAEGLEGDLLYVGAGGEADYAGMDARGRIVLAELSYSPPRPEKTRIASVNGALGLVLINWGDDDNPSVPMGTVKPIWGNPTVDDIQRMPNLPAVGIARRDGVPVRDRLLAGEPVRARIIADADRVWATLHQPHASLGAGTTGDWVLLGDHLDSWGGGATDNATGNAVTLEVARLLAERRDRLRRDVQVAFWQAHENGIMEGSSWFVDHYWDAIDRGMAGYINVDSPGMRHAERYRATLSPELWTWHRELMQATLGYVTEPGKLAKTGDQSFFGIGVPAISGRSEFPEHLVARWHGAVLAPWYQSADDTIAVADQTVLAQDLAMTLAYAWELATRPVLPMDFRTSATILQQALEGYRDAADATIDFAGPLELTREFAELAAHLWERCRTLEARFSASESSSDLEAEAMELNAGLKRLSRLLIPLLGTVVGRYGHDTYGLSALRHWVPGLARVGELGGRDPASGEHMLWWGALVRERNRVSDTLREAIRVASGAARG